MNYHYGGYPLQQQFTVVPNAKYKTMLCRHYEATKYCSIGDKCQFAHGYGELRNINDPLPSNALSAFQQQQKVQNAPAPIIKSSNVYCKYYNNGFCRNGNTCSFLHDDTQVKNQVSNNQINMQQLILHIISNDSNFKILLYIIQNLQQLFINNNQELHYHLKQAEDLVRSGNNDAATQIIKQIVHNEQRTATEKDAYSKIYAAAQQMGEQNQHQGHM